MTATPNGAHQTLKNTSFESRVISWLMHDGWQVFIPILDHGHQTDILISDGLNYYRIQVKTVEATGEDHIVENRWMNSDVDVVIFFARNSTRGYITPAFEQSKLSFNSSGHKRINQTRKEFLKAFHEF